VTAEAGTGHAADCCSAMDRTAAGEQRRGRGGTLGWTVFLVVAVVLVAALIAGAIRGRLAPADASGERPALSGAPSPSPVPLPRPGPAPPRTIAGL